MNLHNNRLLTKTKTLFSFLVAANAFKMKLRTRFCKKNSLKTNGATEESAQKNTNYPLICVDWSSNEEIYFVR